MKILVDADACPVKEVIIKVAKEYNVEVIMALDSAHVYDDDYATVHILDKGFDSVDYFILSKTDKGDIVVTGDYGLAALVLTKEGIPISPNGLVFKNNNIDSLLLSRYKGIKTRKSGNRTKGPPKRSKQDDIIFKESLIDIIKQK